MEEGGRKKGFGISSICSHILPSYASILCLGILAVGARAQCGKKPVVFNFGDSNSDTGGYSAGHGVTFGPPFGRAFFHEQNGRFSDGRLMIDFFCESLNASYLSPYLESLGSNFANGANFAIGGAATLPRFKPFSLDLQVLQFLRFRERSLLLSSEGYANQVREDFKNALYIIDIGQNDLSAAFTYLSYEQVIQNITTFVTEIKSAVWDIYKSGGKNFWIHNTGPLGCLPRELATTSAQNPTTDYDSYGCLVPLNNAAKEFNGQLRALCEELQSEMTDATIVYIDVYSAKYDLIANAANYGFEKPLMVCCGYGGPPYNFNPDFLCGNSRSTACDPGQRYVSWDGVHYTEAANSILAANILSSNFSTPQINLNFFCNV
ncbi:hypothetical protein CDL15_Pgr010009 [Punica granatum]|uniref:GDSL esterase/lipase At1g09390-like n=2 Tax=Punica granatum TaxID=22663 RepID=A0A218X694_PUNGR|nr:hypothetical protein CDL15_Pgr010009 [Punica granatum]